MSRLLSLAPLVPSENELVPAMLKIPLVIGTRRTLAEADLRRAGRKRAGTDVVAPGSFRSGKVFIHREDCQVSSGERAFYYRRVNTAVVRCVKTEIADLPDYVRGNCI